MAAEEPQSEKIIRDRETDPVWIELDGPAPGHPGMKTVTKDISREANSLIESLDFGKLEGNAGTIKKREQCRIDRQPPPPGGANIQVQHKDSSIATCVIESSVLQSIDKWPSGLMEHQQFWLIRKVRKALKLSLKDGNKYSIKGSFSNCDSASSRSNLTSRQGKGKGYRVGPPADPSKS